MWRVSVTTAPRPLHLRGVIFSCPFVILVDTLELNVSAFEVLVGAAPGYEIRLVPWPSGSPPPLGAVVVGVSARGEPLLAGVTEHYALNQRCVSVGYTSTRENLVTFAFGDRVQRLPW